MLRVIIEDNLPRPACASVEIEQAYFVHCCNWYAYPVVRAFLDGMGTAIKSTATAQQFSVYINALMLVLHIFEAESQNEQRKLSHSWDERAEAP